MSDTLLLFMNRLNKTEFAIFISSVFASKASYWSEFIQEWNQNVIEQSKRERLLKEYSYFCKTVAYFTLPMETELFS